MFAFHHLPVLVVNVTEKVCEVVGGCRYWGRTEPLPVSCIVVSSGRVACKYEMQRKVGRELKSLR